MPINISGTTETEQTEQSDIVGRFRSGYQTDGVPSSLSAFRITTGDPKLMAKIAKEFGVDKTKPGDGGPSEWEAAGEDYLEVFTNAKAVTVILDSANDYKSSLVRRTADGDFMYSTDGTVITAVGEDYEDEFQVGNPDPQANQDLDVRKAKAKKGLGSSPDIRVVFSIEGHEDWGKFQFRSGGWSLVHNDPEPKLRRLPDGPIRAELRLTTVEGKKFTWTKPELNIRGSLVDGVVANAKPSVGDAPF